MRHNIYLPEQDEPTWRRAQKLANREGRSVSEVIADALAAYVSRDAGGVVERQTKEGQRIRIHGRLLAHSGGLSVYYTPSCRVVLWDATEARYGMFPTLAEARLPAAVLREAERALGTVFEID
jgi:predicted transcriptional regulator